MSGYPLNFPTDAAKLRQNYLANLSLQANINDMNLQANKIYKKTGQTPTQPTSLLLPYRNFIFQAIVTMLPGVVCLACEDHRAMRFLSISVKL